MGNLIGTIERENDVRRRAEGQGVLGVKASAGAIPTRGR